MEQVNDAELQIGPESSDHAKMTQKSGQKTRKQTRFSIASSPGPLGTITNLVLPGEGSPAKNDRHDTSQHASEVDEYDDDENEIFFGPISDYETRKASKLRRRTVAYTPNFRAHLLKTPSKGSSSGILDESDCPDDEKDHPILSEDNPIDVTADSVFSDSVIQDDLPVKATKLDQKNMQRQSEFYSASEFVPEDGVRHQSENLVQVDMGVIDSNESIYHQARSMSEVAALDTNLRVTEAAGRIQPNVSSNARLNRQLFLSENDSTPVPNANIQDAIVTETMSGIQCNVPGDCLLRPGQVLSEDEVTPIPTIKMLPEKTASKVQNNAYSDSPARLHLAASKIQGWFRMSKQKRSYSKAFKDMSNLKDKTAKFLQELRMEQRSRGTTPTNSPIPSKIVKKSSDEDTTPLGSDPSMSIQPSTLVYDDSSDASSQDDVTEVDGFKADPVVCSYPSVTGILQETASRLQSAGICTPTRAGSSFTPGLSFTPVVGTPQSIYSMGQNQCNSPLVFSSPKVFPVMVQAQQSRNPMCSVTFSPHTPSSRSTKESSSFSPAVAHNPSPALVKPVAVRPSNDSIFASGSTNKATPCGSAFSSVGSNFSPLVERIPSNINQSDETPDKENVVDSPNITLRSRRRNITNLAVVPGSVQVVHPQLPLKTPATAFQSPLAMSPAETLSRGSALMENSLQRSQNLMMSPGHVLVGGQVAVMSSPRHGQVSHFKSLLQQKQEELTRIRAEKQMLQQKIKEDNTKCFQMRHEIIAALRSNMSPEGLPPMDSHVVILGAEGPSTLTLNDQELDVVTRLHTIRNSHATIRDHTYDSPVAHDRHQTGRVRLQWHHDLVTPISQISSPHLHRLHIPATAHSILTKK